MEEVFRTFCDYIKNRFKKDNGHDFSEDTMRYILFYSLMEKLTDVNLCNINLEYILEKVNGIKLDAWINANGKSIAMECKYHRKSLQRKSEPPRTMWGR